MRVPHDASPAIQQALRDIHARLDRLGTSHAPNVNLKANRITNAGDAVDPGDYVTARQTKAALDDVFDLLSARLDKLEKDLAVAAVASQSGGDSACEDTHEDFSFEVAAAKTYLEGIGADLSGPCGAFSIVELAVSYIQPKDATVGFLDKPDGNNCNGFAADIICFFDGAHYDVLIGGGDPPPGGNAPTWDFKQCVDNSRYRAP